MESSEVDLNSTEQENVYLDKILKADGAKVNGKLKGEANKGHYKINLSAELTRHGMCPHYL